MANELTPEQRLENIKSKCLAMLENGLEDTPTGKSEAIKVKDVGEALKALGEGIESYRKATTQIDYILKR